MESDASPAHHRPSLARRAGALLALALVAAAMWAAWLGWDTDYYEVDGVMQGPYREWQVIGCGASVVVAALIAQAWTRGSSMAVALACAAAVGFAVPWTVRAMSIDDTGLFAVGLMFLLGGMVIGLGVLLSVTEALWRRRRRAA